MDCWLLVCWYWNWLWNLELLELYRRPINMDFWTLQMKWFLCSGFSMIIGTSRLFIIYICVWIPILKFLIYNFFKN
jgi:hypothetical protein